ncbi:MAG: potassium transporter [Pseudomonadota bacterium]
MNNLKPTDHIWILGAGRFGTIAAGRLAAKVPLRQIRVIDHRPDRLLGLPKGVKTAAGEAIEYIFSHLGQGADPDWIVPAVPVHVAWEFIRRRLGGKVMLNAAAPDPELLAALPNAMTGQGGAIYASIADFICPDNCPEPPDRCTHTGQPRPMELFQAISDIAGHRFLPVVIRSHQLAPGVGGYKPNALRDALEQVNSIDQPVLLATACRCHGVLHLLNAPQ